MKLSETSVKRPVLAMVMSLAIILLGVISYGRLGVREYPDVDPPVVSVTTLYRGASPSVVETEVTDVLEEQFATLEDVKTMTSSSREQGSTITIEFELGRDVDQAANDVRDRVSRIRGALPREAEDPVIPEEATGPGFTLSTFSSTARAATISSPTMAWNSNVCRKETWSEASPPSSAPSATGMPSRS